MSSKIILCVLMMMGFAMFTDAQTGPAGELIRRCGAMESLAAKFKRNPQLKIKFEAQRTEFNRYLRENPGQLNKTMDINETVYTIPVVFHIVLPNPSIVTDQQIQAQLDTLNHDFFGTNSDSVRIPAYFRSLFGKSHIQFCLAQRTPGGEGTNGIERVVTSESSFSNVSEGVKYASSGGAAIWDNQNYFNVWVCMLSGGILGYGTFPENADPREEGVVIDYRGLPGGSYSSYSKGKTLTHETGHYFNLYHIWGDDDGACSGTDFIDDTPPQGNSSNGSFTGVKLDNCTSSGNGIMYQDYMDYTDDQCLVMFTTLQVSRMESALMVYHSSLLSSPACQPLVSRNIDAQLKEIVQPQQRLCVNDFSPVIIIRNIGAQQLTALNIKAVLDNGATVNYSWTGSLNTSATATVTLDRMTVPVGNHILKIAISNPDNTIDENPSNDTLSVPVQYYDPVVDVSEGFEQSAQPPAGWDIVNPDKGLTWKKITGISKTGNASMVLENFNAPRAGQKDDLRLPSISIPAVDSVFLSFQVATASAAVTMRNGPSDTLEVLASLDCGQNYTSLYKKYGSNLVSTNANITQSFVPASSEWRKDSINLGAYINAGPLMLAFRNTSEQGNNVYLDDIGLRKVIINKNLKEQGFLVTPNPADKGIAVQFYPQPDNLASVQLYNAWGQKLKEVIVSGQASSYYYMDLSGYAAGVYIVRAVFSDKVLVKKIIKQ